MKKKNRKVIKQMKKKKKRSLTDRLDDWIPFVGLLVFLGILAIKVGVIGIVIWAIIKLVLYATGG